MIVVALYHGLRWNGPRFGISGNSRGLTAPISKLAVVLSIRTDLFFAGSWVRSRVAG